MIAMDKWRVVVAHGANDAQRAIYDELLGPRCELIYLKGTGKPDRAAALAAADVLITLNLREEIAPDERLLLSGARLIQQLSAGIDHVPFSTLPQAVPVASNAGAYAEPMAEHIVAVAFAAAKRLLVEDRAMRAGEFNQWKTNRMLAGGVCAILGFGGIGQATARRFRALGMTIHAINRSGVTDESVDLIGTLGDLEAVLRPADVIVISLALTKATDRLIGKRELAFTKEDAILINVARGELIDQDALYHHLLAHPHFTACLDAWWIEPVRHGVFELEHPFLELSNVLASPHNSATVPSSPLNAARRGAENVRRAIDGLEPLHLATDEERLS